LRGKGRRMGWLGRRGSKKPSKLMKKKGKGASALMRGPKKVVRKKKSVRATKNNKKGSST